ncbi:MULTISPECIES: twin-arginine translocase TatA/TatE family subunit [unclassified Haladaptatus]|uniref:twin-arginine translocase TatA/TatE family subunit n=1 Tax=unclassified Haladaptatus TaxID=2622732 RepID=UPI00209C058E|nr:MULTISPECIES: twin-arginine translocase TatA/TatE family subunit [unclassified Haladaptatus]MCO8245486.1 twin-arginine translocase TatA/TatE family subunit [Haladaptatus sp. AB643]MCO8255311.1 twin-arginine translocase TatA/TatE family subunit [Haladaptatus sp. AB618]
MVVEMIPLFGPIPGGAELVVILLIAVLLFGANKIPELARSTGEAMGEFKKGREEVETELREMQDSGTQTQTETETNPSVETEAEAQ